MIDLLRIAVLVCALFGFPSGASSLLADKDRQFDLIGALQLPNQTYQGLSVVAGVHHESPAVSLQGDSRHLKLPDEMLRDISRSLSEANEFSFIATIKQSEKNTGTILSFADGNERFLELQSSGRRNEIRLHYTHKNTAFVEAFPYDLTDNNWHQVAVSISGNTVNLYVDCSRIYRRLIYDIDLDFNERNISLWLGQRNAQHFLFKGVLQDVKVTTQPFGYMSQCPNLEIECPTCGQFQQLQKSVLLLENHIKVLTERLADAEHHISLLQQCDCEKSCFVNGSYVKDGREWNQGCDRCTCKHGEIECVPITCAAVKCKHPITPTGECCPICLKECLFDHVLYEHGEKTIPLPCATCECMNGSMHCWRYDPKEVCPILTCPEEQQFSAPDECCRFCLGVDYCSKGHDCHRNASCINLNTHYTCQCNKGYEGSGKHCTDINECLREGGHDGHHCRSNSICVNILGDYVCECLSGYKRVDKYSCADINECSTGENLCHENAMCINLPGSYACQCQDGFFGDGYNCKPVCSAACQNGGHCVAPDICSCLPGYSGFQCESDIDECYLDIHMCHLNSNCVNMPGWYYCQCKPGYENQVNDIGTSYCQDIDECLIGSHTCDLSSLCVNDDGAYHCECADNSSCSSSCLHYGEKRLSGEMWSSDMCTRCDCVKGVVSCVPDDCDCSKHNINLECCPECDHSTVCHHQELSLAIHNGEKWIYKCQTCECLNGEVDCWDLECPPVSCEKPQQLPGDCCPRCDLDSCSVSSHNSTLIQNKGCAYNGIIYKPGERVPFTHDPCSNCHCRVPYCQHSISNSGCSLHRMDQYVVHIMLLAFTVIIIMTHYYGVMKLPLITICLVIEIILWTKMQLLTIPIYLSHHINRVENCYQIYSSNLVVHQTLKANKKNSVKGKL